VSCPKKSGTLKVVNMPKAICTVILPKGSQSIYYNVNLKR
jgi:hypothetical protein